MGVSDEAGYKNRTGSFETDKPLVKPVFVSVYSENDKNNKK